MNLAIDLNAITRQFQEKGFVHVTGDTPLSSKALLEIAGAFGSLLHTERHTLGHPALQVISNDGLFGCDDVPWHNDWSYGRGNFFGTLLYNKDNAEIAPTRFVDMEAACEALPVEEQTRLRSIMGCYFPPNNLHSTCFTSRELKVLRRTQIKRPFVFDHPSTNRPILYFSPATLRDVVDADVDLENLIEHCEALAFDHLWKPHDLLLYDNFRLMHRRPAFHGTRTLWRIQFDPGYEINVPYAQNDAAD